jgi:ribosome assembly protein YihI (activator of Der GTPase)
MSQSARERITHLMRQVARLDPADPLNVVHIATALNLVAGELERLSKSDRADWVDERLDRIGDRLEALSDRVNELERKADMASQDHYDVCGRLDNLRSEIDSARSYR